MKNDFKPKTLPMIYGDKYVFTSNFRNYNEGNYDEEYTEQLKYNSSFSGFGDSTIDILISEGCSFDEIKEFLYTGSEHWGYSVYWISEFIR